MNDSARGPSDRHVGAGDAPSRSAWIAVALGAYAIVALTAATYPELLVLWTITLGVVLLGLVQLPFLVYLAVFLMPWQIYLMNWSNSTYTFRVEDILLAVASAITVVRRPESLRICLTPWMMPLLMFVLVGIGSGLWHGEAYGTGKFIADWWPTVAFYWLMLAWHDHLNWRVATLAMLASFAFQAALGAIQTAVGDPEFFYSVLRSPIAELFFDRDTLRPRVAAEDLNFIWRERVFAFGTYLASTGFAVLLAGAASVAWALALSRNRSANRAVLWIIGAASFSGCLLTFKRSGVAASVSGLLVLLLSRSGERGAGLRRRLAVLGVAAILMLGLVRWKQAEVAERIADQAGSVYSRENIVPLYVGIALKQPLFGYGPSYPMGSDATGYWDGGDYEFGPENTYLHVMLTAGAIGLGLFLCPFLYAVSQLWKIGLSSGGEESLATIAGLIAIAVGAMFVIAVGDLKAAGLPFFLLACANHIDVSNKGKVAHREA